MAVPINAPMNRAAVRPLADQPLDGSVKGLPTRWWGQTPRRHGHLDADDHVVDLIRTFF